MFVSLGLISTSAQTIPVDPKIAYTMHNVMNRFIIPPPNIEK
jgi:hypothetical protein